ncbi:MAG: hypothetical protein WB780_04705 [Candidatus Acidiferrales bacterium]
MKRCTRPHRRGPLSPGFFWLVISLFNLLIALPSHAQTWEAIGPTGGDVRALAVDPSHPQLVYLGTTDGHIFGSQDRGDHWTLLGLAGTAGNAIVTAIIVDPRDSETIFAATWTREKYGEGGGVFLSSDGGKSWRDSGLSGHAVRALIQAPSDPEILVAGTLDGVFRSRNRGRDWDRITPERDPELFDLDSLSIDPLNPQVTYAGTFHLPWKTVDGGEHWFPIHQGMIDDSDVLSLAVDNKNPRRIFSSACSGIYRSEDAGSHWQKIQGIPYSSRRTPVLRMDPSNPAVLYAGTTEGLWKSPDGGATWRRISPADWVVNSLAVEPSPANPEAAPSEASFGRVLVGTEQQGVLSSDDGGDNFHPANEGFHHRRIVSLAANPEDPAQIVAVVAGSSDPIVGSNDGGRTWSPMSAGLDAADISHVYSTASGWWAALASGGLAHFDSEKAAWARVGLLDESASMHRQGDARITNAHVATARATTGHWRQFEAPVNDLAFSDAAWFAATDDGLFVSRDEGLIWTPVPFAPLPLPVNSVRVSRDGQKLRIVSSCAMVFSDDAGETWQWHDLPLESGGALRLELADPSTALALSPTGLYISRDAGISWRKAQAGLPHAPVSDLFVGSEIWLASVEQGGLYFSRDQGATWSRVKNYGHFEPTIEDLQFPALLAQNDHGIVLVGSSTEGLFVLDLAVPPAVISARASGK